MEPGNIDSVASHLQNLLTDSKLYREMSFSAQKMLKSELLTPYQATSWMWLFIHIMHKIDITLEKSDANADDHKTQIRNRNLGNMWKKG